MPVPDVDLHPAWKFRIPTSAGHIDSPAGRQIADVLQRVPVELVVAPAGSGKTRRHLEIAESTWHRGSPNQIHRHDPPGHRPHRDGKTLSADERRDDSDHQRDGHERQQRATGRRNDTTAHPISLAAPAGNMLELILLHFDDGRDMVIHAMPVRRRYHDLLPHAPEPPT